MGRIDGKVVIVTGGASGLGQATAIRLAEEGARLLITDLNEEGGQETVKRIESAGGEAHFVEQNVANETDWKTVMRAVDEHFPQLDVLVNNAGVSVMKPLSETTLEEFRWQNGVLVDGVFLGMKYAMEAMERSGGGSIINISSIAGITPSTRNPAYCGAKGAVRLLTKACALECAQKKNNIRVNSLHPGFIRTPLFDSVASVIPNLEEMLASAAPIGRIGEPDDIANGVLYLASDDSKYVTGSELVIDGGFIAQ
jgi:NAD(P)-dependent dehydrogenase (short-subunit alcohol dehydrogenase family)